MTVISTAIDEAIALCGRPDKRGDGIHCANAAIGKLVRMTTWPFDRKEVTINFVDTTLYTQRIPIFTDLPNFRKMNYVRSPSGKKMEMRDPSSIITPCGNELLPSYYITGTDLLLKDEVPLSQVAIGYYIQAPRLVEIPSTPDQTNTHWTLELSYLAVVYGIMAEVFAMTGDDTSYGIYENKAQTQMRMDARDFRDTK